MLGLQCHKLLWVNVHRRDLIPPVDEATQRLFDIGHEVGTRAHELFDGGVLVEEDHLHIPEAIKSTEAAVGEGERMP